MEIKKDLALKIYGGLEPEEKADILGEIAMNVYRSLSEAEQAKIDDISANLNVGLRRKMQDGGNPNVKVGGEDLKTKNLQLGERGRIILLTAVALFIEKQEIISAD